MFKSWFRKRLLPIIMINGNLNEDKCTKLMNKMKKINYNNVDGVAIIVNVQKASPVQVDKIHQFITNVQQQYNIPLFGFTSAQCTPQSYYLISNCNKVYSTPSTIFTFGNAPHYLDYSKFYSKFNLTKLKYKSNPNAFSLSMEDKILTNLNFFENQSLLQKKMLKYSLQNRRKVHPQLQIPSSIENTLMQKQAIEKNLIDEVGQPYPILLSRFNSCSLKLITYQSTKIPIKQIIILLFLFKVFLKYSIIVYIWYKAKNS